MDELTIGDKIYISSKRAAQITGYAKDYVGQLCREGHVEATMVGRSWYVLESSIRSHRFGNETKNDQPKAPEGKISGANPLRGSWEAPAYQPESVGIPTLTPRPNTAETLVYASVERSSVTLDPSDDALTDMQAAWREWFEKKQQNSTESSELLEASVTIVEEVEADSEVDNDQREEQAIPEADFEAVREDEEVSIPFHAIQDESLVGAHAATEEDAEPVRIHRTPEPAFTSHRSSQPVFEAQKGEEEDVFYVREYRSEKKARTRGRNLRPAQEVGNPLLVQTALIGVMLLAVSIAVLGSGIGDAYMPKQGLQHAAFNFFNGTTVYEAK